MAPMETTPRTARKLGANQRLALETMFNRGRSERPFPGGWTMGNLSQTVRILESLERHGLVKSTGRKDHLVGDCREWHLTEAGREEARPWYAKEASR